MAVRPFPISLVRADLNGANWAFPNCQTCPECGNLQMFSELSEPLDLLK